MGPDSVSRYDALLDLMRERRSVRKFTAACPQRSELLRLVEAARWAPSAGNRQAHRWLLVTSPDVIARMADAVRSAGERLAAEARADMREATRAYVDDFSCFRAAPSVIVPIYRGELDLLGRPATDQALRDALSSVSAATMCLLLAAEALGLGACWMTGPLIAEAELGRLLRVPLGWQIASLVPIGFAREHPPAPPRRALERLYQTIGAADEECPA